MATQIKTITGLESAYKGSYYTIIGAGGDPHEWVNGYTEMLKEQGIGTPLGWLQATGAQVNAFAQAPNPQDRFQDDLVILLFPLTGLEVGKLAMFKIQNQDRWFDDVIDNMRRA